MKHKKPKKIIFCEARKEIFKLNGNRYILDNIEKREMTKKQYDQFLEARGFMESIGGTERYYRSHTNKGYVVTKVISTSPDKKEKYRTHFIY